MCDWRERQRREGGREIMERGREKKRERGGEVKGVVRGELRQMSGIDEARSNTDTQL